MSGIASINVVVGGVFNQVADRVRRTSCPITTPVANVLAHRRVAIRIKRQGFASSARLERQRHVVIDIIRAHAHGALDLLVQLLHHNDLAVELFIQARCQQIASRYKVSCAAELATADNGQDVCAYQGCAVARSS